MPPIQSPYIPNTEAQQQAMLRAIGVGAIDDLFADIPPQHRHPPLALPPALSELQLLAELGALAARNRPPGELACFLGAGAYRHFIPSVVGHILARSEFFTAYTPYQPEISQGSLQAAFEFQSMVCELTGMEVANAGMYDGASALAEACLMAAQATGRRRLALLTSVNPRYRRVVRSYAQGRGLAVDEVTPHVLPGKDVGTPEVAPGQEAPLTPEHACLAVQQPSFFGYLEDVQALERAAHAVGALYLVAVDPISLGLLKPPGEYGADIVVGEGQSLGIPLSFGGPYLGLFACRQALRRQMPGRIVGRTQDPQGRPGYVLTLQTREQHIRRERATSNICTSQQLLALAAAVYLATLGREGLREVARLCYHKAHYAAGLIASLPGYSVLEGPFFKEFVVRCPQPPAEVNRRLLDWGIIGGLDISEQVENGMLLCVTEMNSREEIDRLAEALGSVNG